MCVCVSPRLLVAQLRDKLGHTNRLSIVIAPELIWRFSYNGSKIAIAFPYTYERSVVGHFLRDSFLVISRVRKTSTRMCNRYIALERFSSAAVLHGVYIPAYFIATAHI